MGWGLCAAVLPPPLVVVSHRRSAGCHSREHWVRGTRGFSVLFSVTVEEWTVIPK